MIQKQNLWSPERAILWIWVEGEDPAGGGGGGGPEPDPPADPPQPDPPADPGPSPEPPPDPDAKPAAAPAAADWKDRRIATLTARLRAEEAKVRELASAPKSADPGVVAGAEGKVTATEAEIEALVASRAEQRAVEAEFARRCNETAAEGAKEFGEAEFRGRVQSLVSLVDGGNPQELMRYHQLLVAAMDTGKGPALLHRLGGDLNAAGKLLEMAPARMGIELARMADAPTKPEGDPSGAPRPIRPVGGAGAVDRSRIDPGDPERSDQLTTAEWMRRRNAQDAAKRAENGPGGRR